MSELRLFVYYKLPPAAIDEAVAAVRTAHGALRDRLPGLQAELLRRPPVAGQHETTLMETYVRRGAGIDVDTQMTIESTMAAALAPWLAAGARHVEVFEPLTAEDDERCAS